MVASLVVLAVRVVAFGEVAMRAGLLMNIAGLSG
jgi:hypothetical protein